MSIIPYPPGIPIACPGEVLDKELLEYVKERRLLGEKVIGLNENMMIQVGKI
jgi:lysine decarboxylase